MTAQSFVYENAQAASEACARKIIELLTRALATERRASLAVSGGTTPKLMFAELAKASFDWSNVHLFWVDERLVPPTDSQSNYKLTQDNFIDRGAFPVRQCPSHSRRASAEGSRETL